ncbi:Apoptosis-inducing factor 3 [Desmophyllum pertusum]|uniref:Apoptosis-inducing factor 3 n=1 Tax=Desmophyllum pertusum TaxID=174260 RepID=A0A9W9YCV9_9CNID|nr:Apoptosis-inducing factor 3 [Desmophyllum pertusum]
MTDQYMELTIKQEYCSPTVPATWIENEKLLSIGEAGKALMVRDNGELLSPVVIKNDNVIVRAHPEQLTSHKRVKKMVKADTNYDKRVFVSSVEVRGSAMKGAETLREEGFKGRVVMVTKEAHLPYDRPLLSKDHDIEFISGAEATTLDSSKKTVTLSNGTVLNYDNVLIATGGKPRTLNVPGSDLENIFLLRSPDDANKIASFVPEKKVVIIGTSLLVWSWHQTLQAKRLL